MAGRDCQAYVPIMGVIALSRKSYLDRMFHLYPPRPIVAGSWSRGYDVALTWRRSQVQFLPSPPIELNQYLRLFKDVRKPNPTFALVLLAMELDLGNHRCIGYMSACTGAQIYTFNLHNPQFSN